MILKLLHHGQLLLRHELALLKLFGSVQAKAGLVSKKNKKSGEKWRERRELQWKTFLTIVQMTPSVHGGTVSEPMYR